MKKILILATALICLVACGNDEASPTAPSSTTQSSTPTTTTTPTTSTPTTVPSTTTPSYQNKETKYVAEVGTICNGFNFGAVSQSKATEGYIAMYEICGDRATQSTGTTCYTASEVTQWMKSLQISAFDQVNSDIAAYGASFRWYNAVDGYKRYIYIEPCYDGKGLMKKSAK